MTKYSDQPPPYSQAATAPPPPGYGGEPSAGVVLYQPATQRKYFKKKIIKLRSSVR